MKKFKGFNEPQLTAIAKSLGFNGPLEKFNEFLAASPQAAAQFGFMSEKARKIAEGRAFSSGGVVTTTSASTTSNTSSNPEETNVVPFAQQTEETKNEIARRLAASKAGIPAGARPETALINGQQKHLLSSDLGQLEPKDRQITGMLPSMPKPVTAKTYETITTQKDTKQLADQYTGTQGEVSQEGQMQAAQMDPRDLAQLKVNVPQLSEEEKREGTVQKQLEGLASQFEDGKIPPWAAGIVRNANAMMAARGLGTSSLAASAAVQAAMEAATAIATTDAQLTGQYNLANLDVRKQRMLSNAAAMTAVDLANLNNRQQAEVQNAQAFLQMDFKNMDSKMQAEAFGFQAKVNSLLSDQAQRNAARQFNAQSENQTQQFFSELAANIDVARANMKTDISKFNSEMTNQREQFNSQMALVIEQANTQWRQQVTTANTAAQNLSNQITAAAISRMNEVAYNSMIQLERDEMSYVNDALTRAWQSGENFRDREVRLLTGQLDRDAQARAEKAGYKFETGRAIGSAVVGLGTTLLGGALSNGWSSIFRW